VKLSRRHAVLGLGALAFAPSAAAQPQVLAIHLLPLGPVDQADLDVCAASLGARLKCELKFGKQLELPQDAWYAPRKRWRAEKLLDHLEAHGPREAWKLLGVTRSEISTTKGDIFDWGIAGLGALGGRPCVLSTFLYKKHSKTRAVFERRLADITAHEFGHTLGMNHCDTKGCVMSDAKGKAMASADASSGHYCPTCRGLAQFGPLILRPSPFSAGDGGR
jgi:archaemetzincin